VMMMCDVERLVSYVYDEVTPEERTAFERHMAECADCRNEVKGMRQTRAHLASWAPPEPDFGFRIVRTGTPASKPARFRSIPGWGLAAAAAVLVFAASAAIANIEVRYGADGLMVRTGWAAHSSDGPAAQAPVSAALPVSATSEEWRANLKLLDERIRQLEGTVGQPQPTTRAAKAAPSDTEVLGAVRRIVAAAIEESEGRQEHLLKTRFTQLWRDIETVRAGDFNRFEQGLRQVQGLTDAQLMQQRETLNHLIYTNVSGRQQR
jgi:hypothetical protein